jgi:hypothetical protein
MMIGILWKSLFIKMVGRKRKKLKITIKKNKLSVIWKKYKKNHLKRN